MPGGVSDRQSFLKALRPERLGILREVKASNKKKEELEWFVSTSNAVTREENGFFPSPLGRERKVPVFATGAGDWATGHRDELLVPKGDLRGW